MFIVDIHGAWMNIKARNIRTKARGEKKLEMVRKSFSSLQNMFIVDIHGAWMKMRSDYARGHQWITCSASAATDQSFPVDIGTSKFFSDFSFMSKPIFITKEHFILMSFLQQGNCEEKNTMTSRPENVFE